MSGKEKILDDVARMAGGAMNVFSGLQKQIREETKTHIEDMAARLDLVPREDFEKLEAMVSKFREEQGKQNEKIAALEKKLAKNNK